MKSPTLFSPLHDGARSLRHRASLLCFACIFLAARAADAPRVVMTHFVLPAQSRLLEDYSAEDRARCQTEVAAKLAALGRASFNYLTWQPEAPKDTGPAPAADLILTLTETHRPYGEEIGLTFSGRINGKPAALNYALPVPLYKQTELDRPTGNPDRLIGDVVRRIEAEFNSDAFRNNELQPKFLGQVPVAITFNLDPPAKCVLLPIPGSVLRADGASRLRVEYSTPPRPDSAFLFLHPAVIEKWEQPTRCFVDKFQWLPESSDGWTPALLDSYQQCDQATVRVFVSYYAPDYRLPTQDARGRATQPND